MLNIVKRIVGTKNERELKRMRPLVEQISQLEPAISALSGEGLRAKTDEFRTRIRERTATERAGLEELQAQLRDQSDTPSASDPAGESKDLRAQIEEQDKALRAAETRSSTTSCPKPSRWSARRPSTPPACGTSTSS